MSGRFPFCFALLFSLLTFPLGSNASNNVRRPTGSADVLYVQQNTSILTYDVDPTTGQATLVGQPLTLNAWPSYSINVIPSPTDQFLYIQWTDAQNAKHLWVYPTDSSGVPQQMPVQKLNPTLMTGFEIDPNGRFAYGINSWQTLSDTVSEIRLFTIDSSTGKLTQSPAVQARYVQNGQAFECGVYFLGFSPDGSELYNVPSCYYHDSSKASYLFHAVDSQTGTLGPDQRFFSWSNGSGGVDVVNPLGAGYFAELTIPNNYQLGINSVNVYPLAAGQKQPVVHCDGKMLADCANASGMQVNPVYNYLFFSGYPQNTDIAKVDFSKNQIVDTGYSLPSGISNFFSPDGLLIYGVNWNFQGGNATIQVYLFNPNTGAITDGSQITVPTQLENVFPAH